MEIKNFSESLEKDLERLAAVAKEKQKEIGGEKISQQEILKQSLKDIVPLEKAEIRKIGEAETKLDVLPSYLNKDEVSKVIKQEVEQLVNSVFQTGLEKTLKEARRKQPFIEDAFHDALVDKLLPELKKRGLI